MTRAFVGTFRGLTEEQTSVLSDDFVFRGPGTTPAFASGLPATWTPVPVM